MNVRDGTRHDIHKSAALHYAILCIVTGLISDVHFHITGPKLDIIVMGTITGAPLLPFFVLVTEA